MKAAVHRRFGSPDVVTVEDVPEPVPRADEVLVRIHAATVGVVDGVARRGTPFYARIHFGLSRPRFAVLGTDFAGEIQATGPAVTRFAVGDQVFGTVAPRFGAHAEYVCLSEHAAVAPKPANVGYAEAAALVDATALCFLRDKAKLQRGQSILINGASGAVGTAAVQLARHFGTTVTGVCSSANTELVRRLGVEDGRKRGNIVVMQEDGVHGAGQTSGSGLGRPGPRTNQKGERRDSGDRSDRAGGVPPDGGAGGRGS
jgi:NADPH:quinone reductase-like Zn-dependent oxidoreductase